MIYYLTDAHPYFVNYVFNEIGLYTYKIVGEYHLRSGRGLWNRIFNNIIAMILKVIVILII